MVQVCVTIFYLSIAVQKSILIPLIKPHHITPRHDIDIISFHDKTTMPSNSMTVAIIITCQLNSLINNNHYVNAHMIVFTLPSVTTDRSTNVVKIAAISNSICHCLIFFRVA